MKKSSTTLLMNARVLYYTYDKTVIYCMFILMLITIYIYI